MKAANVSRMLLAIVAVGTILLSGISCSALGLSPPARQIDRPLNRLLTPTVEDLPRTFSGSPFTSQDTPSFSLTGGDYVVDWTVHYGDDSPDIGCFFSTFMTKDDGPGFQDVVAADVTSTTTRSVNLDDVSPGQWHFEVMSRCQWTMTIHR